MPLLDQIDFIVGVDTHKATHTAAVLNRQGAELAYIALPADASGYKRLLGFARAHAASSRLWAIEGTGSFGRGLTSFLLEQGEQVAEIDRPARPARRNGAKSDLLDATRAAREALAREHLAQPRGRGDREALRVLMRTRQSAVSPCSSAICHLRALIVTAPERLRNTLRNLKRHELLGRCAHLRSSVHHSPEQRATVLALHATARRVLALESEADELESHIKRLVQAMAPQLLRESGVGALSAAEILLAWSHPQRLRSEAAFAALAGAAPIPASSGQTTRHRLNRCGDRRLNCALHTIVLSRWTHHPQTRQYVARRTVEGKSEREIRRCLKRYLARHLFRLLEAAHGAS